MTSSGLLYEDETPGASRVLESLFRRRHANVALEASDLQPTPAAAPGAQLHPPPLATRDRPAAVPRVLDAAGHRLRVDLERRPRRQSQIDRATVRVEAHVAAGRDRAGEVDRTGHRLEAGAIQRRLGAGERDGAAHRR